MEQNKRRKGGEGQKMYECTLQKEGFLGTFYESPKLTGKAVMLTMEKQYPAECRKARRESWAKLVSFFQEW